MTPQASASERIEAARTVLATYGAKDAEPGDPGSVAQLTVALRSLLSLPPADQDAEDAIIQDAIDTAFDRMTDDDFTEDRVLDALRACAESAVAASIQHAHETWEPADIPSQEFMLRNLGIKHKEIESEGQMRISIRPQWIKKEEI